jgi:hypothetical protein
MAPQESPTPRDPAQRERTPMDTTESSAPHAHPSTKEHDSQHERPHACNNGWVTMGQIVVDPETGEETEEYALYLCHRCAKGSGIL